MKTINTTCKFCGIPVRIVIDADYMGTIEKLLPLAACNRCADLRVEKRKVTENIVKTCIWYKTHKHVKNAKARTQTILEILTKRYVELINDWERQSQVWDPIIAEALMEKPDDVHSTLRRLWPEKKERQEVML